MARDIHIKIGRGRLSEDPLYPSNILTPSDTLTPSAG